MFQQDGVLVGGVEIKDTSVPVIRAGGQALGILQMGKNQGKRGVGRAHAPLSVTAWQEEEP